MRRAFLLVIVCGVTLFAGGATAQQAAAPSTPSVRLTGTIKDIMIGVVDPAADAIWEAVFTEVTVEGVIEHQPRTAEEWAKVERDALILAESANLLKMPGRVVARQEEMHGKSTSDPAELTPAQIEERLSRGRSTFARFADLLQTASEGALKAARTKDKDALFAAGEEVYNACVVCHQTFWYPGSVVPQPNRR